MGPDARVLDDIARVAGGAVNILGGLRQQIREEIKARLEDMADHMDLVPREDVDILKARIDKLEARIVTLEKGGKKTVAKATVSKKPKTKAKAKPKAKLKAKPKTKPKTKTKKKKPAGKRK